jgi:hypothetical protein
VAVPAQVLLEQQVQGAPLRQPVQQVQQVLAVLLVQQFQNLQPVQIVQDSDPCCE